MSLPVLYSLQNCPYAMRARLAILQAQQRVAIRALSMKNIPPEMLALSPKGTVPVLIIEPAQADTHHLTTQDAQSDDATRPQVIDESLDIMLWALTRSDPQDLLYAGQKDALPEMLRLIDANDHQFKPSLERYKRARRFHHADEDACRLQCEPFIQRLEERLGRQPFLMGVTPSLLDYALLPFVRQFARADRERYRTGPYPQLRRWLTGHLQSQLFSRAMLNYPLWMDHHQGYVLGDSISQGGGQPATAP